MTYEDFFSTATGNTPYSYQRSLADAPWPETRVVPTGFGKTAAVVLAWLWKVRNNDPETPRRLVYCLPMRSLVEQTESVAQGWLKKLRRADSLDNVTIDVLMGGRKRGSRTPDWIMRPDLPTLLIGTQDLLVSAALMRGYGVSRYRWPVDFALLNNGAFWVFDEVQLAGAALATSAQLEGFRRTFGAARQSRTLWMSATLDPAWLHTPDFEPGDTWRCNDLSAADFQQANHRWTAKKTLARLDVPTDDISKKATAYADAVAAEVVDRHRPGKTTIVFLNTVPRAQAVLRALRDAASSAELLLVHSRFRPGERKAQVDKLMTPPGPEGRIVVATQALEAGVDVTSAVMITELAPWSSLVQRFGRVNRGGEENASSADVFWIDLPDSAVSPYDEEQLATARVQLSSLTACGPADLAHIRPSPPEPGQVIRRRDLLDLFDTDADLAGFDIDVSPYVRDADDTDVRVFWREVQSDAPLHDAADPERGELCSAPVHRARELVKRAGKRAWHWDPLDKRWRTVSPTAVSPGMVIWVDAAIGGYDAVLGFDAASKARVETLSAVSESSDDYGGDRDSETAHKVSLEKHTAHVIAHVVEVAERLGLTEDERAVVLEAAAWHDWGKAHDAFVAKTPVGPDGPPPYLAKWSRSDQPSEARRPQLRKYFRHELASALGYLAVKGWSREASLIAYLIAAHHGKVRMRLRALPGETAPSDVSLFARGVYQGDKLPKITLGNADMPETVVDLDVMSLGDGEHGPSWVTRTQAVLSEHGPLRLAWLEALLRIADWRASAQEGRAEQDDL